MARSLKTRGMLELKNLRHRVMRQHMYGRITMSDRDYLVDLLNKFEARVISMTERGSDFDE